MEEEDLFPLIRLLFSKLENAIEANKILRIQLDEANKDIVSFQEELKMWEDDNTSFLEGFEEGQREANGASSDLWHSLGSWLEIKGYGLEERENTANDVLAMVETYENDLKAKNELQFELGKKLICSWLEQKAKASPTGISFDWVPSVDGEPSGFRFMRRGHVGEPWKSIFSAINDEIKNGEG